MDLIRIRAVFDRLARVMEGNAEDGQGLAEYALILALIAIISIVALLYLGQQISDKLSIIGSAV
jgi:Flp pilus assembly pilin Flp